MAEEHIADPAADIIEKKAHEALRRFPEEFREHLVDIVVHVQEFADAEMLASVGLENPRQLVGLYRGHPINKQSIWASGDLPPTIFIFRQPLLARWKQSGASLDAVISHLIVHEVGHHFGFSDKDMEALEQGDQ